MPGGVIVKSWNLQIGGSEQTERRVFATLHTHWSRVPGQPNPSRPHGQELSDHPRVIRANDIEGDQGGIKSISWPSSQGLAVQPGCWLTYRKSLQVESKLLCSSSLARNLEYGPALDRV